MEKFRALMLVMAVMLLACLCDMPYGYYNLVRISSMVVFGAAAFRCFQTEREEWGIYFSTLAVLFQPIFKIALGRTVWNVVDVVVAITLVYFVWKQSGMSDKER